MKIFLFGVIFGYLSTTIDSAPVDHSADGISCFIMHFKTLKRLEQSYPDSDVPTEGTDCEKVVNEQTEFFETNLNEKLEWKAAGYENCVLREVKRHGFYEEGLLSIIYKSSSHMSEIDKIQKIAESDKRGSTILTTDIRWCKENKKFGDRFDAVWKLAIELHSEEQREGYCIRKYVVDEGLIDTNLFKVTLNPNNKNTEGVDCEESIKIAKKPLRSDFEFEFRQDFYEFFGFITGDIKEYEDKYTNCAMKEYDKMNIGGRTLSIVVLSELNVKPQQIASEREKYIEARMQLTNAAMICGATN